MLPWEFRGVPVERSGMRGYAENDNQIVSLPVRAQSWRTGKLARESASG